MNETEKTSSAEEILAENKRLKERNEALCGYLKKSTNRMLKAIGTAPLADEELEPESLLETDPIGVIAGSFEQIVENLHQTNTRLGLALDEQKAVFDSTGVAIVVTDSSMRIISHNSTAEEFFGLKNGMRCYEGICAQDGPPERCSFYRAFEEKRQVFNNEFCINNRIFKIIATPIMGDSGRVEHIVLTYSDITDKIRSMESLEASERRFRDLFENANDLIQAVTPEGEILYVNNQWLRTLGYSEDEIRKMSLIDFISPPARRDYIRAMEKLRQGAEFVRIETSFVKKSGGTVDLDGNITMAISSSQPTYFRGIFRDVTSQKVLEAEFNKAQRLESVGLLAGGIAHDFNNLLTGILGNISLARLYEKEGLPIESKLTEAERAAVRAQGLTQQLLAFSRGGSPVKRPMKLEPVVREAVAFASSGSNCSYIVDMAPDLWTITADSGQIDQIIQNIVLNAVQAMPNGGKIYVSGKNIGLEEADVLPPTLGAGSYIEISIADEGAGISPENIDRVFDPYFTTKTGGIGLGLSTVYSVAKGHGGAVKVESSLGHGAVFRIFLPADPGKAQEVEQMASAREYQRGQGNILVMDDDEIVLSLVADLLGHLGYTASQAKNGEEAIEMYTAAMRRGKPFDAVILDLTIRGGMGGKEAVREIRKIDPGVKAIVSSGYSQDPVMASFAEHGFSAVVAKPYRGEMLASTLKSLLNGVAK